MKSHILLLAAFLMIPTPGPLRAEEAGTGVWQLTGDLVDGKSRNADDLYGNTVWYFMRTTEHEGSVGARQWLRNGKYGPLENLESTLFGLPISGAIYRTEPTMQAPFVGGVSETHTSDVTWNKGELILAPGPEHAVVLGWRSPYAGELSIQLTVNNRQTCCGGNSAVRWYLERGPAPDLVNGFKPELLASGISDDQVDGGIAKAMVSELDVEVGDFIYVVIDAKADGTANPHHGDGTMVDVTFTIENANVPPPPTFEEQVQPLLAAKCLGCHGSDSREADLDLRTVRSMIYGGESGTVLTPGDPARSYLWTLVQNGSMPPEGEEPLSRKERSVLLRWIEGGAKTSENLTDAIPRSFLTEDDRDHWAFQKAERRPLPVVKNQQLMRSPVDAFVLRKFEQEGLSFSSPAAPETLVRRLFFDLLGLPPEPAQIDEFLADRRPGAYSRLVDRLLASPRYGERWGRHWMDTVGYVDVRLYDGDATTVYPNEGMWRYRDYIIRSFNEDKPFDLFIREQLAGDEMVQWRKGPWSDDVREKVVATGYLRNIEDHTSEAQYGIARRYEVMFDMMSMVSTSLLGMTIECARCHNHKYDPITQRDYYSLMAFFESSYNPRNWLKPQQRWVPDVGPEQRTQIDAHNARVNEEVAALQATIKELAKQEAAGQEELARLKTQVAQLESSRKSYGKVQALFDVPNPPITNVFRRGDCFKRGIAVDPAVPELFRASGAESRMSVPAGEWPEETSGRRLQLAQWITSTDNPMTARVIMNRLWLRFFGEAIVETPDNLGRNGARPTHPGLLEWLAVEFQQSGWSLKHMHRMVVTSRAYQQSSRRPREASLGEQRDPENQLLWRQNLKRLESEAIRDSLLAVSGRLDSHSFGPPVPVTRPVSGLSMVEAGPGGNGKSRRSVYVFARRVYPLKFMELFDSPIMAVNCNRRMNSTTVLQSFAQLNSDLVRGSARDTAELVRRSTAGANDALVQLAYRRIVGRPPKFEERSACLKFLAEQAAQYRNEGMGETAERESFADLCHMLLCMNEFLYVE